MFLSKNITEHKELQKWQEEQIHSLSAGNVKASVLMSFTLSQG